MSGTRSKCCDTVEPCHSGDCSGTALIQSLLPVGPLWDMNAETNHAAFWRAVAAVFTEVNKALCQEFAEMNPCTSVRLLDMWASIYCFPDCVDLTTDNMCEWVGLLFDPECPIGSIGFYNRVLEWVLQKTGGCQDIELVVNQRGAYDAEWRADNPEADLNTFVVIAPPSCYMYDQIKDAYFIPEIECLRCFVFPMGVSLGYKTNPTGPNGEDIYGVPTENVGVKPSCYYECERAC